MPIVTFCETSRRAGGPGPAARASMVVPCPAPSRSSISRTPPLSSPGPSRFARVGVIAGRPAAPDACRACAGPPRSAGHGSRATATGARGSTTRVVGGGKRRKVGADRRAGDADAGVDHVGARGECAAPPSILFTMAVRSPRPRRLAVAAQIDRQRPDPFRREPRRHRLPVAARPGQHVHEDRPPAPVASPARRTSPPC